MKLSVLSVAYPLAAVRPDTAGGAEHVLSMLDSALVQAGHQSVVVACKGSMPEGILVATPGSDGKINSRVEDFVHIKHKAAIEQSLEKWNIDLIHLHGIDFEFYLPPPGIPALITLHLPPQWYSDKSLNINRPGTYFNCVSKSQMESCPKINGMMPFIENGVETDSYLYGKNEKENFALSLGRVCEEKGYHCALDAAKLAGVPLIIAGELYQYEYHIEFFRREIEPRLDGDKYVFIGPAGPEKKRNLLSKARCVLIPSLVPETSSLVAMEAMASGTPVIAYPQGALKDIVEDGKTGFLVNSIDEMSEAIKKVENINPEVCRQTAKERFSAQRMINDYFSLYKAIIVNNNRSSDQLLSQAANNG